MVLFPDRSFFVKLKLSFLALILCGDITMAQAHDPDVDTRPRLEELDLTIIMHGLAARDFKERKAASERLIEVSRTRFPQVIKALFGQMKNSKDPEVRSQSEGAFQGLFDFHVLGKGDSNLGVLWHWHIKVGDKGEMRARPIVRTIEPDSLAAKAGLKEGDLVCYVNGKELHRQKGILALRQILRETDPDEEITLTVRNSKFLGSRATTKLQPNRKVTLKVGRADSKLRTAKKGEFRGWLNALKAEHDME